MGEHLRFAERSRIEQTPWSMVQATESFLGSTGIFWGKIIGQNEGYWRAYSQGPGESVTRGDRRGRERWFGSPSPPLAGPCE
jgi:hypothetical protein